MSISIKLAQRECASVVWLVSALLLVTCPTRAAEQVAALGFDEAVQLAVAYSARLTAQVRAMDAAQASIGPAGQLPDPQLTLALDNLPLQGADRWRFDRDSMTMRRIGVLQDFPRVAKRRLREERARAAVEKERMALAADSALVQREAAAAWLSHWFALARLQTLVELQPEIALLERAARVQFAAGKGSVADAIAARSAVAALQDRLDEARRDSQRAKAALERWIGGAAARPMVRPPELTTLAVAPERLLAAVDHHPNIAAYAPLTAIAQAEVGLARAAKDSDWSLELAYQQRGAAYADMFSVAVRIDLPLWSGTRQVPLLRARERELEQVQAAREDARRMHLAELQSDLATWHTAVERANRARNELVPLAKERTAAALAAYRSGRGDLTAVLQARSSEIESRVVAIQLQAELGQAWTKLNFLLDPRAAGSE
jgi:outer membrane protein TolC